LNCYVKFVRGFSFEISKIVNGIMSVFKGDGIIKMLFHTEIEKLCYEIIFPC
jgi:hypothetical protein